MSDHKEMVSKQAEIVKELQAVVVSVMRSEDWKEHLGHACQALSIAIGDYERIHYFHTLNPDRECEEGPKVP